MMYCSIKNGLSVLLLHKQGFVPSHQASKPLPAVERLVLSYHLGGGGVRSFAAAATAMGSRGFFHAGGGASRDMFRAGGKFYSEPRPPDMFRAGGACWIMIFPLSPFQTGRNVGVPYNYGVISHTLDPETNKPLLVILVMDDQRDEGSIIEGRPIAYIPKVSPPLVISVATEEEFLDTSELNELPPIVLESLLCFVKQNWGLEEELLLDDFKLSRESKLLILKAMNLFLIETEKRKRG